MSRARRGRAPTDFTVAFRSLREPKEVLRVLRLEEKRGGRRGPRFQFVGATDYRKNSRRRPLIAAGFSRGISAMSFFLSCWFWFARWARRRATGRSAAQAGRFAFRSAAENASRGRNEQREAQRVSAEWFARGCSRSALRRNGRRRAAEAGTSWSAAAASVEAFQRDVMVGDRAAEQAKPSRAVSRERPAMRTGPQGAKRPEPQGDQRERDRRPAATAPSAATAVVWRRLRRARHPAGRSGGPGLIPAGADVNAVQRSGTERTTATARILAERRFVRATAPHTPPPGPTAHLPHAGRSRRRSEQRRR